MSKPPQSFGETLTAGIQNISGLLPLLGTDQCEKHVGSALDGGLIYAAATPMSLFGSLGIVKAGISILISSISIPKISISYRKRSIKFFQDRWLGAKTLDNAGFKLVGTVSPLISMDGTRYMAETRVIQSLGEKHIDNPENLSIEWKSRDWNIRLIMCTIGTAMMSTMSYPFLLFRAPSGMHMPGIFPLLRTVGSCLAIVCCQFLIQSRVISLMKSRIVFMVMNRILIDDLKLKHDNPELDLGHQEDFRWDVDLPAEYCLWSLEQFFSRGSFTQPNDGPKEPGGHVSITMKTLSFSNPESLRGKLQELRNEHFPAPAFDHAFFLLSWIILCLSLPATVAGYIGCFMLVSNSQGIGPLLWVGTEVVLSIIRILFWASKPKSDKGMDISVRLKLTKDQPLVTTEKDVRVVGLTGNNTLPLVPERRFLKWITPYTGPLEQFQSSENLALYFTLTGGPEHKRLYMTVFELNKRIAVTLHKEEEELMYADASITYNHIASEMEAMVQSVIGHWRTNDVILFDALTKYYNCIMHALNRTYFPLRAPDHLEPGFMVTLRRLLAKRFESDDQSPVQAFKQDLMEVTLRWKWSLPFLIPTIRSPDQTPEPLFLTEHDKLYFGRGYEHHLKTKLIENWSRWIVKDMDSIRNDARNDCHQALADETSETAKWELTELDTQLAWEWTRRELSLVTSSITLEGILGRRMEKCIDEVAEERGDRQLKEWMQSEFEIGQRKRLEKERAETKERMEKAMKAANERAEREGRRWRDQGSFNPQGRWEAGLQFIDEKWCSSIEGGHSALENAVSDLDKLAKQNWIPRLWKIISNASRHTFLKQVKRFDHWDPQRENERHEMDATIKRIRDADSKHWHLDDAYRYPGPDPQLTYRFVNLHYLKSALAKFCSATVYDVEGCDLDTVCDAIERSTTCSVVNVDPALVDSIPENDHLLYIGSESGKEPAFIQRNRDRWWDQQTTNSSMFYFSPQGPQDAFGRFVSSRNGTTTIAHICIFLKTPSRLQLRLLHSGSQGDDISVSIQENSHELHHIFTGEIPEKLQLQDFELDEFEPGRHELELVVCASGKGTYGLRDIFIEFVDNPPRSPSSVAKDGSNMISMEGHAGADAEPSGI